MSLRALVFGAGGQVGRLVGLSAPHGALVLGYDSATVDVRDETQVSAAVRDAKPEVIFNCAAWTRVDDAQAHAAEAMAVNGEAPGIIGAAAAEARARVIHLSTDYVFSGRGDPPYAPDAPTDPLSVYGATKLEGERRLLGACNDALVIRTAWVHSGHAKNFIASAVSRLVGGTSMQVVDDQIGTPTRAHNVVKAMWLAVQSPSLRGVMHFTDAGVASWFDVATCVWEVLRAAGRIDGEVKVAPTPTSTFRLPADRPRCAVLDKHSSWRHLGWTPPHWRVGVTTSTRELLDA